MAREVGVEGRLGGQANVPGAAGTWKDLTDNVNLLAANLTTQVRAIAEVATAVTKGDLTRSIQVEARGEVAELKDNINTMIDNLRADDGAQHRAGLAEDQPRQVHQHAAGPARPGDRRPAAALRTGAAGQRAAGRHLPDRQRRRRAAACGCCRPTPTTATAPHPRDRSGSARAWSASAPRTSARILISDIPADIVADPLGAAARRRRATSSCCRCCSRARSRPSSSWPRSQRFTDARS